MRRKQEVSPARIKELLSYDPDTGDFTWTGATGPRRAGRIAGSRSDQGYWRIKIAGKHVRAGRLAYLIMNGEWPEREIHHVNGIKDDNRWCNLSEAARGNIEASKPTTNPLGVKGVRYMGRRYSARIAVNGERIELGLFDTKEEAAAAYKGASVVAQMQREESDAS